MLRGRDWHRRQAGRHMAQQSLAREADAAVPSQGWSEDWLSVAAGLLIFALALALLAGADLLGWATAPRTWLDITRAVRPSSASYAQLDGPVTLIVNFTVVFWLAYLCWVLGNYAYIAVTTPAEMQRLGLGWSLRLTGESGYLIALIVGLLIANFLPGFAVWLNEAV